MVKPFQLTYLLPPPPFLFYLLLIVALLIPEYKLKVVNICKCTEQGDLKYNGASLLLKSFNVVRNLAQHKKLRKVSFITTRRTPEVGNVC